MLSSRSKLGQAEPISIIILTGIVVAIALAVYGYFASQAAIASYNQRVQNELVRLKFNTILDELYFNGTDHFLLVKRLDTSNARILLSLVAGEYYSDTILVYSDLISQHENCRVYLLESDDGMYILKDIASAPYPSISIPLVKVYLSMDKPSIYTGYTQVITVYDVWAKPSLSGCNILLDAKITVSIDRGYPILMILESIDDRYYIIDTLQLRGVYV